MLLTMCHRCALCRSVRTYSEERGGFSPLHRGLFVSQRGQGEERKESAQWQMQLAIGFCFQNEQTLELFVPCPPNGGGGALKGWEGFLPYWFSWLYSTSASYKWCLRNRTAERLCVTNMTRLLPACFVLIFTYYCVLVLSKGEWSLAENFQILLSRFTLQFCRLLSFAVLLRAFNVPQSWLYRFLPHKGFRHFSRPNVP